MTKRPPKSPDSLVPDFELWDHVARAVKPLKARRPAKPHGPPLTPVPVIAPRSARAAAPPPAPAPAPAPRAPVPPPLTGLDRRTTQKLTRGQVEIEARLDLHGHGLEIARVELARFLRETRARGLRTVLVITGKGASPFARHTLHGADHFHTPERQGRLRKAVTDWFEEAEFRALIAGFQPAHPRHGGGGAYYVRLRRDRSAP